MRKPHTKLRIGSGALALALAGMLAASGCSTNRNPDNGQPGTSGPMTSPASPTSTPGSAGQTPVNPPMASSMIEPSASLPVAAPALSRADVAAAIMASHQGPAMRVLGPLDPEPLPPAQRVAQAAPTGQFVPPALYANPQVTVNSSISSAPTPVIASGTASDAEQLFINAQTGALTPTGANAAAPVIGANTASLTPTNAGGLTPGQFAAGAGSATAGIIATPGAVVTTPATTGLTPTISAASNVTPTSAANPTIVNRGASSVLGTGSVISTGTNSVASSAMSNLTTTSASVTSSASLPLTTASGRTTTTSAKSTASVVNPVRVVTSATGGVVITNQPANASIRMMRGNGTTP